MDPTPYLVPKPAPCIVFDALPTRRDRVRFHVPEGDGWRDVTWGAFAADIRDLALWLQAAGMRRGDHAAILAPNSVEWITAALAIQAAGGVMVPVYASCTAEQVRHVVGHSDARFVFVATEALASNLARALEPVDPAPQVIRLDVATPTRAATGWSDALAQGRRLHAADQGRIDRMLADISMADGAVMLYTSGTSGLPKGVPLTHENVGSNGRDWLQCNAALLREPDAPLGPDVGTQARPRRGDDLERGVDCDVDLLWLPMSHIFGFGEACLGNTLGFETWLCEPIDIFRRLPEVRPTVFMSVPAIFEKIASFAMAADGDAAQAEKLVALTGGRFHFLLSGGAGLSVEVKRFFHRHGLLIIEGYGLTEASPTLTLNRPDAFRFDSVGLPLPSVELRLADDGEILARGPNVFAGYHKDPEATAATLTEDGWLCTGDVGRFTEDGFLQIIDRKKDIFVLASGKNVPPANIELRFADDDLIEHVVLFGDGRRYLTAGVWLSALGEAAWRRAHADGLDEGQAWAALELEVGRRIEAVNAELARHETIKRFALLRRPLTIEDGLLTATLKVRRRQVHEAFADAFEALYA